MKTFLISYDLGIPESSDDYKRVIDYIKSYSYWATPLKSVWFIKTDNTVATVRDEVQSKTDSNDGILVLDVSKDEWSTFGVSDEVTEWMKNNL